MSARLPLLTTARTALSARAFLAQASDEKPASVRTSTDGTRAWRIVAGGERYFAKWATPTAFERGLARDAAICAKRLHPAVVRLANRVDANDGALLIFDHAPGATLQMQRRSARFFNLPVEWRLRMLTTLFDGLAAIAQDGWVFGDLYDGNVMVDPASDRVTLFDFEYFQRGPYVRREDESYGSKEVMAPEECCYGARIDGKSNVYTMGRLAILALCREPNDWGEALSGMSELRRVIERATLRQRARRFPSAPALAEAFRAALDSEGARRIVPELDRA